MEADAPIIGWALSSDRIVFSFPWCSCCKTACTTTFSKHLRCMTDELIRGEQHNNQLTAARQTLDGKLMAVLMGIVVRQQKEERWRMLQNQTWDFPPSRDGWRSSRHLPNHQIVDISNWDRSKFSMNGYLRYTFCHCGIFWNASKFDFWAISSACNK